MSTPTTYLKCYDRNTITYYSLLSATIVTLNHSEMEELLCWQSDETLTNWIEERGITPSSDLVQEIIDYYSWYDVLYHSPSNNELCDLVFTSDEILANILHYCAVGGINRQWMRVSETVPKRSYIHDSFYDVDWRGMSHILTSHRRELRIKRKTVCSNTTSDWDECVMLALGRGYDIRYFTLGEGIRLKDRLLVVTKGSDNNDRYVTMFAPLFRTFERGHSSSDGKKINEVCATANSTNITMYMYTYYKKECHLNVNLREVMLLHNRFDVLNLMLDSDIERRGNDAAYKIWSSYLDELRDNCKKELVNRIMYLNV